jgi:ubiquinone/menaquinone biosynthesis C-methylase UbiE
MRIFFGLIRQGEHPMNNPWQYDETIQVGTDYRDEDEVRAYDRRMQTLRDVGGEVKDIQRALLLSSDSTVWEIGTGTGECALALAPAVRHVYASDVSPAMLEYARRKAEQRGVSSVTFEKGGFLSGFRPGHAVDGIITQLALHHLPDFWKSRAFDVMTGSLRPGGRLYLRDVVFPSTTDDYDAFFKTVVDGVRSQAGDEMAQRTTQHIKTEFSTLDWILEGMMTRSGLGIVEKSSTGFVSVYVCERIAKRGNGRNGGMRDRGIG